jgi:hypothetical protein
MFGTLREKVEDLPLIAAIHVWVAMPENAMTPIDVG